MEGKRFFSKEFKENAVALAVSGGRKQSEVAAELGIEVNMLCRWKREVRAAAGGTVKAFPGKGQARDEEMSQLRKENADLRETNEILKKAMAFFVVKEPR